MLAWSLAYGDKFLLLLDVIDSIAWVLLLVSLSKYFSTCICMSQLMDTLHTAISLVRMKMHLLLFRFLNDNKTIWTYGRCVHYFWPSITVLYCCSAFIEALA